LETSMLKQRIVFCLAVTVLVLAGLLGGGQGFLGDVLVQLASVLLLTACFFNSSSEFRTANRVTRILSFSIIAIVLFVPLLQLYPWPGTSEFALAMQKDLLQTGVLPTSAGFNKTYGAERALFSLLPACAIFIACLQLPNRYRYRLIIALAIIALLNILLGFAQLAQGPTSALRLYEITNTSEAVGFFANRNHYASLLMMCLPLSIGITAWWAHQRASRTSSSTIFIVGGILFSILLILAIAVARSRAGLLLGVLGVMCSLPAIFALPRRPGMKRVLAVVAVLGLVVALQFGLTGILERFDHGVGDNTRTQMTQISIEAGKAYAPMGSGLGTFRQAYAPFEARHEGSVDHTLTNHAHNDYAELWLEAGYPALFAIAIFWLLFIFSGFRVWWQQQQADSFDVLLSRVAWVSVLMALLHSFADYPLRATANSVVFGMLLAIALLAGQKRNQS
jgi:O-antigen ligase